jgi:predicted permease
MSRLFRIWRRLLSRLRSGAVEADLDREIRAHLQLLEDDSRRRGLSDAEARADARRRFGGVTQTKERHRDARGARWFPDFVHDARYAARAVRRSPGFALVAIGVLGLGIGAATAIFTIVGTMLLQPLPYAHADRFVRLMEVPDAADPATARPAGLTRSELDALRSRSRSLSHLGVMLPVTATLGGAGLEAAQVNGIRVSPPVLTMLDRAARIGRVFRLEEEARGFDRVIVLSDAMWRRRFAADPGVLDRTVSLDGVAHRVVGVMPADFGFPDAAAEYWVPFVWPENARPVLIGRLRDGVSFRDASDEATTILRVMRLDPLSRAMAMGMPLPPPPPPPPGQRGRKPEALQAPMVPDRPPVPAPRPTFRFVGFAEQMLEPLRPALAALSAGVALLLLVACVNVATLLLARTAARARELAVRSALGAERSRLRRQLLTEAMLVAVAAGVAGLAVAQGGLRLFQWLGTSSIDSGARRTLALPRIEQLGLGAETMAVGLTLAIGTGVIVGLISAARQSRTDHAGTLRDAASAIAGTDLLGRHRLRAMLLVAQVAMAVLLVVGGGLLIASFTKLTRVDPGFDANQVLTFQVPRPGHRPVLDFLDVLVERLEALPGVASAGYADQLPMGYWRATTSLSLTLPDEYLPPPPPAPPGLPSFPEAPTLRLVGGHFIEALNMRLVDGRGFDRARDVPASRPMLVNEVIARSGILGEQTVGSHPYAAGRRSFDVIGVVGNAREFGLDQAPGAQVFVPYRAVLSVEAQTAMALPHVVVRVTGDPLARVPAIRALIKELDPEASMDRVAPLADVVAATLLRPRLYAVLAGLFAIVAATIALVGLASVVSFAVVQRTQEIGIRLALGAARHQVLALVLRQTLTLAGAGVAIGLAAGALLTRYLDALLFGLSATDPTTFVAVPLGFALVVLATVGFAARRALTVDPLITLRNSP